MFAFKLMFAAVLAFVAISTCSGAQITDRIQAGIPGLLSVTKGGTIGGNVGPNGANAGANAGLEVDVLGLPIGIGAGVDAAGAVGDGSAAAGGKAGLGLNVGGLRLPIVLSGQAVADA